LQAIPLPEGASLKVVEPPPGPPVMATLLAEIYGPDAETRRAVAARVEEAFRSADFIVDIDNSWGQPADRARVTISTDNLEFFRVQEQRRLRHDRHPQFRSDGGLFASWRRPHADCHKARAPTVATAWLTRLFSQRRSRPTSCRATGDCRTGRRGDVSEERASFPVFRHNGRAAEMVMAELAGTYEAPLYGMIAVQEALDAMDWSGLEKPVIALNGQPTDEQVSTLLWDGEWEVTWVTFRDMGAAFGVALLGIYILVVPQFGSFKAPLVILTPVPLTFIGILRATGCSARRSRPPR
jgi:multidrug efflux pump subunit AcrB